MKKFEYPLESVLKLRRFAEAEARQALAEALAARNEAEQALSLTRLRIQRRMERLTTELATLPAVEIAAAWEELDRLEETALKQTHHLADCEHQVALRTEAYIAAQQERKPLERLRDEMRRAHDKMADLAEQAAHDELAVIGHQRKGGVA
jgi:flagellar FliJ protein